MGQRPAVYAAGNGAGSRALHEGRTVVDVGLGEHDHIVQVRHPFKHLQTKSVFAGENALVAGPGGFGGGLTAGNRQGAPVIRARGLACFFVGQNLR